MDLVTWNVNSLRAHLDRVVAWLERRRPDVVCLQETKCADAELPRAELEALGYQVTARGEKGRNGVAILTRGPLADPLDRLPGHEDDAQARFLAGRAGDTTVVCVYVPNGQGVGTDAFFYKLDWLSRLLGWLKASHDPARPLALVGDFNVCPTDLDVHAPDAWRGRLHCTDHERRAVAHLQAWGLVDALRRLRPDAPGIYSWFDYGPHALRKNEGLRIDLVLVTAPLAARLVEVEVDLEERRPRKGASKPSDHCPVLARFR